MTTNVHISPSDIAIPKNWDRNGLPGWTYANPELCELERDVLFRRHWQLAGHVSNVAEPGQYFCFDMIGERALIVHGNDGIIRAFHNVCRHRGSRVVADDCGQRSGAFVCPFHGWSFHLDGTFRSAPAPKSFPPLDREANGLIPIEMDIWNGFIFIRFSEGDQPPVAKLLERHNDEIKAYLPETLIPSEPFWTETLDVNWKAVRDVDNEGYHVPIAHPALQDLFGANYFDEPLHNGSSRSFSKFTTDDARLWSVRNYKSVLPEIEHLPAEHRRAWLYLGVFPNAVFGFYPDSVIFYQEVPVSPTQTMMRGCAYRYPDESRELRLARYLSSRIDRETADEDIRLIRWSSEATQSSGYQGVMLSDLEYGVKSYHDALRNLMPVVSQSDEPAPGTLRAINDSLAG